MINLLIITGIVCFIVDISGFVDTIKRWVWKWLFKDREYNDFELKPIDCSLCMSFWIGLIYLICVGQFNVLMIGYVCLLSLLSSNITGLLIIVREGINYVLSMLSKNL